MSSCETTTPVTYPGGKARLYVDATLGAQSEVVLGEGHSHYLLHVLRAKPGNRILLFNGHDGEWLAEIALAKKLCIATCLERTARQQDVPDIWLAFAPIKKTPADYLAQKACELGISRLQPVFTRRTVVRRVNSRRLWANLVEAAEQSGRLTVPELREPVDLEKLISEWPRERQLFFCDEAGDAPAFALAARERKGPAAIITGPEGGFDQAERQVLRSLPFVVPVHLGTRILRADTAALAALAIWQSVAGDWH